MGPRVWTPYGIGAFERWERSHGVVPPPKIYWRSQRSGARQSPRMQLLTVGSGFRAKRYMRAAGARPVRPVLANGSIILRNAYAFTGYGRRRPCVARAGQRGHWARSLNDCFLLQQEW